MAREHQIDGAYVNETADDEYQAETVYVNETVEAAAAGQPFLKRFGGVPGAAINPGVW